MLAILCLKIFGARILDVSLGTIRTILTVKGKRLMASITGLIEVTIWFLIVKEALNTTETSFWIVLAYAGGFATGTYIGAYLSDKFIKGNFNIQIITEHAKEITDVIRKNGYGVTRIPIEEQDTSKEQNMLLVEIDKKHFSNLQALIKKVDPKAFIIMNETKYVQNGFFK